MGIWLLGDPGSVRASSWERGITSKPLPALQTSANPPNLCQPCGSSGNWARSPSCALLKAQSPGRRRGAAPRLLLPRISPCPTIPAGKQSHSLPAARGEARLCFQAPLKDGSLGGLYPSPAGGVEGTAIPIPPPLQAGQSSRSSSGGFSPLGAPPGTLQLEECGRGSPGCPWKPLALHQTELKPFPGHFLPLHALSAPREADDYLLGVLLNEESGEKPRFRTRRAAYHFLPSRAGLWRVIHPQVTDSRVCDETPGAKTSQKGTAEPTKPIS